MCEKNHTGSFSRTAVFDRNLPRRLGVIILDFHNTTVSCVSLSSTEFPVTSHSRDPVHTSRRLLCFVYNYSPIFVSTRTNGILQKRCIPRFLQHLRMFSRHPLVTSLVGTCNDNGKQVASFLLRPWLPLSYTKLSDAAARSGTVQPY